MPADVEEVDKIEETKFLECPLSAITADTWDLISLVNETTTAEGNYLNISHLPDLAARVAEIEPKYRAAVRIVKAERNSGWFSDLQRDWAKQKAEKEK